MSLRGDTPAEVIAMRAYHVAGFLALFFWQSAPFRVSMSHARFRVSFAAATGRWEDYYERVGCNGEVLESRATTVPTQSFGARGDVFLDEGRFRLTAVLGGS